MAASKAVKSGQDAKTAKKPVTAAKKRPPDSGYRLTLEDRRKGGQARAASYKRDVICREIIKSMAGLPAPNDIRQTMIDLGLPDNQQTLDNAMVLGQYIGAAKGDSRCATWLRDTLGQMPTKQLEITDNRSSASLLERLLAATEVRQSLVSPEDQAYVTLPISAPEVIEVSLDSETVAERLPDDTDSDE